MEAARASMEAANEEEDFLVLPENWSAVRLFLACETQWNKSALGSPSGLRYEGVQVIAQRLKLDTPEVWRQLQVMERVALKYWSESSARR